MERALDVEAIISCYLDRFPDLSRDEVDWLRHVLPVDHPDYYELTWLLVQHQMLARADLATQLALRLLELPAKQIRRLSAFTLRCDNGCRLAHIFGRTKLNSAGGGPPNNELLVCWTTKGWRAELIRWYISSDPLDTSRALPIACKHGSGLWDIGTTNDLVVHAGPDSLVPDTLFPLGAVRRLSDSLDDADAHPAAKAAFAGHTVGWLIVHDSWRIAA